MNPQEVALWCALPLAIGISIDALQMIATRGQLAEGGLFGYRVLATGRPMLVDPRLAPVFAGIFRYPAVLGLAAVQLGAASLLLAAATLRAPELVVPAGIAAVVILTSRTLLNLRNQLGLDGSDQMSLVVCVGVAVALLVPDRGAQAVALGYVALQLLLSYSVAGIAKAVSPAWRSGSAMPNIMSTVGFGLPPLGAFLHRHPRLALAACWSVIVLECAALPAILLGTPAALAIIGIGLCFHLSVAVLMGLNGFLWSFAAAYPALLLLAHAVESV